MERYNQQIILPEIGNEGQQKINNAKVLVIGAGGLGCPLLQYLCAGGVGKIGIVDFDTVDKTNLQRQILFDENQIGKNKALCSKEKLELLNSEITIYAYPIKLTPQNAISLFKNYDIIVDCTDNFETRYLINDISIITKKPLVYASIFKFSGQVSIFNYKNSPSYRCVFPTPPKKGTIPNCSEIGVLGILAGIIGTLQANEVFKIILGIGENLAGKLLCYNALTLKTEIFELAQNKEEIQKVLDNKNKFSSQKMKEIHCEVKSLEKISIVDALKMKNIQFIDVREEYEQPKIKNLEITYIPLSNFENELHKIDVNKQKILFCKMGVRSVSAVEFLQEKGFENCFSIQENIFDIYNYTSN